MRPTQAMREANGVRQMADAFNPTEFGRNSHIDVVMDVIEAALLYGARRISKNEFLDSLGDLELDE